MLIVGSDRLSPSGLAGAPDGTRHAVDRQGRVLCRSTRARFTWPHLAWEAVSTDEAACRLCAQVRAAQQALAAFDPYPGDTPGPFHSSHSSPSHVGAHAGVEEAVAVEEPHVGEEPHVERPHVERPHVEQPHVEQPSAPMFAAWLPAPGLFVPNEQ